MICLTGDVHHTSLMINDQKHIADAAVTEIRIAARRVTAEKERSPRDGPRYR